MKKIAVFSKISDYILNFLIVLFTLFLLASIYSFIQVKVLKNDHSSLFGYSFFEIQTGSMHGSIEIGDWILVKSDNDIKVGDVITFKQGNSFITHRVVEAYKDSFVTKGDANNTKDKPIDRSQIVGKVKKTLHSFGILKKTIFNPIVIVFLIITFYFINQYFKVGKKSSKNILNLLKNKFSKEEKKDNNELKVIDVTNDEKVTSEHFDYSDIFSNSEEESDEPEDELSKTILFRKITVSGDADNIAFDNEMEKEKKQEDLSKTSLLRIIKVDDTEYKVDKEETSKDEEEDIKQKRSKKIYLKAEEIEEKEDKREITKEYLKEKINAKKAKNIFDKVFIVKSIMYNEIIDTLVIDEYSYIKKSSFRSDLIKLYFHLRYFSTSEDRKSFKLLFSNNKKDLMKKYQNDDTKTKAINLYTKALMFIYDIEDRNNVDISKELSRYFKFEDKKLKDIVSDIKLITKYCLDILNEILKKFDTNSFTAIYNRFKRDNNYFGVYLDYNISFSKVYSKYIVDKTYSEGVVSEDKMAVLLNLISCKTVSDLLATNYSFKYFIYMPNKLYGKDKKLDRIVSILDNDYAKSHIIITSTVSNILSNKDDIVRLRKKGYTFALILDEYEAYSTEDLAYILMADYYLVDDAMDKSKLVKNLPKQISEHLIVDNISKRMGECK